MSSSEGPDGAQLKTGSKRAAGPTGSAGKQRPAKSAKKLQQPKQLSFKKVSIEPVNDAGYIDSAMLFSAPSESGENRQQLLLANEVFDTSGETTTKICCMPDG
jgi:hypothetical protein